MDLFVLFAVLAAITKPLSANSTNGLTVLPYLDVRVAYDLPPSVPSDAIKKLKTFLDKLCTKVDNGHGQIRLTFISGNVVSTSTDESYCSVEYTVWEKMSGYLLQVWLEANRSGLAAVNYGGLFIKTKIDIQKVANKKSKQVVILITPNREGCRVPKCLEASNCCTGCPECNTSICEDTLTSSDTDKLRVKLFVTHEAEDLKNIGATIIIIGVGFNTERERLQCWASERSFIRVHNYTMLPNRGFNFVSRLLDTISAPSTSTLMGAVSGATLPSGLTKSSYGPDVNTTTRNGVRTLLPWTYIMAFVGLAAVTIVFLIVIIMILLRRKRNPAVANGQRDSRGLHEQYPSESTGTDGVSGKRITLGPVPHTETHPVKLRSRTARARGGPRSSYLTRGNPDTRGPCKTYIYPRYMRCSTKPIPPYLHKVYLDPRSE